jgi:hypothetical protein
LWTGRIYRILGKLAASAFRVRDCSRALKLETERLPLKMETTKVRFQKAVFFIANGIRISNFTTQKLKTEF